MKPCGFLIILFVIAIGKGSAQIVLSEIMFNPEQDERSNEFIELYNRSETETVDLINWHIGDGVKSSSIIAHQAGTLLRPKQFALILLHNYFQSNRIYDSYIPPEALVLTIATALFGDRGLANDRSETVSLYSPDMRLVGAWPYEVPNLDGHSEEKIDFAKGDSAGNWGNSRIKGGTPGFRNSLSPRERDLAIRAQGIALTPAIPTQADTIQLAIWLYNLGLESLSEATIRITDQIITDSGIISTVLNDTALVFRELAGQDSLPCFFILPPLVVARHTLIVELIMAGDQDRSNDLVRIDLEVFPVLREKVVINEILYNTFNKNQEWIELYNPHRDSVNLQFWKIRDKVKLITLTEQAFWVPAADYVVLSSLPVSDINPKRNLVNSQLPELNNSGDEIVLFHSSMQVSDSVTFKSSWGGGRMVSLERKDHEAASHTPGNWTSCIESAGSTPARLNSVSPRQSDLAVLSLSVSPEKPHAGQRVVFRIAIKNVGRLPIIQFAGKIQANLAQTQPVWDQTLQFSALLASSDTQQVQFVWDQVPHGHYQVTFELVNSWDQRSSNDTLSIAVFISSKPGAVVINEMMIDPPADLGEWIELYHCGVENVDLMRWTLSDSDTSQQIPITSQSRILQPSQFLVLMRDSSWARWLDADQWIVLRQLPVLNDTGDAVQLRDANGRVMDEVSYSSDWVTRKGVSLERIDPLHSAMDRKNWMTCVAQEGHTAGRENSVITHQLPSQPVMVLQPNPFSPDADGIDDQLAVQIDLAGNFGIINIKIFDLRGRMVRFLANNEPSGSRRTFFWNGTDDQGLRCRVGVYILHLEILDEERRQIQQLTKSVILALPL